VSPRLLLPLLLVTALIATSCKKEKEAVETPKSPASPESLSTAGARTLLRLGEQPARWTATHSLQSGDRMEIAILQELPRRRIDFTLLRGDERASIASIVAKDGHWYVTDGEIAGVYRPYMAPLRNPALYLYLAKSELQFFSEEAAESIGPLEGVADGVATFRIPFPDEVQRALEERATMAEGADAGELAEATRSAAKAGLETRVDVETGVILRTGLPGLQTVIDGPHFLEAPTSNEGQFDTGEARPGLLAASIVGQTDSLVMLGHCLLWRPGMPPCDVDTHLLDLDRSALRRVPFAGGTSLPGTFLQNRTEVVVVGTDAAGGMRPFRVHLETGDQFPLGGGPLSEGITLFPRLSPKGDRLVATWMPAMGAHDEAQVVQFDLEGGNATPIGTPMAHSHAQWLPSGEGLLLTLREEAEGAEGERKPMLATMSLDGTLKRLRQGDQPVIVGEDAMLFFDVEAKRWMRAKLDGSGAQRFGNGHATLSHPTVSPDGKSLIFLRRNDNGMMEPVRVDTQGQKVTSVMPEHGLWAWPSW
jgi:hypothetical protein